jgi:hypothetical protein
VHIPRWVPVAALILSVGIGFIVTEARTQEGDVVLAREIASDVIEAGRMECERTNEGIRKPLFHFLGTARQSRLDEAERKSGTERQSELDTAAEYREDRRLMVESAGNISLRPNSPLVDCELAFPLPQALTD